jgi:hypothetical protein
MGDDAHALEMYKIALSLVETKGDLVTVGLTRLKEYRIESFIVRYQPASGWLEVWSIGKVLSVKRRNDTLQVYRYRPGQVYRYRPGHWELELAESTRQTKE